MKELRRLTVLPGYKSYKSYQSYMSYKGYMATEGRPGAHLLPL